MCPSRRRGVSASEIESTVDVTETWETPDEDELEEDGKQMEKDVEERTYLGLQVRETVGRLQVARRE